MTDESPALPSVDSKTALTSIELQAASTESTGAEQPALVHFFKRPERAVLSSPDGFDGYDLDVKPNTYTSGVPTTVIPPSPMPSLERKFSALATAPAADAQQQQPPQPSRVASERNMTPSAKLRRLVSLVPRAHANDEEDRKARMTANLIEGAAGSGASRKPLLDPLGTSEEDGDERDCERERARQQTCGVCRVSDSESPTALLAKSRASVQMGARNLWKSICEIDGDKPLRDCDCSD